MGKDVEIDTTGNKYPEGNWTFVLREYSDGDVEIKRGKNKGRTMRIYKFYFKAFMDGKIVPFHQNYPAWEVKDILEALGAVSVDGKFKFNTDDIINRAISADLVYKRSEKDGKMYACLENFDAEEVTDEQLAEIDAREEAEIAADDEFNV